MQSWCSCATCRIYPSTCCCGESTLEPWFAALRPSLSDFPSARSASPLSGPSPAGLACAFSFRSFSPLTLVARYFPHLPCAHSAPLSYGAARERRDRPLPRDEREHGGPSAPPSLPCPLPRQPDARLPRLVQLQPPGQYDTDLLTAAPRRGPSAGATSFAPGTAGDRSGAGTAVSGSGVGGARSAPQLSTVGRSSSGKSARTPWYLTTAGIAALVIGLLIAVSGALVTEGIDTGCD